MVHLPLRGVGRGGGRVAIVHRDRVPILLLSLVAGLDVRGGGGGGGGGIVVAIATLLSMYMCIF